MKKLPGGSKKGTGTVGCETAKLAASVGTSSVGSRPFAGNGGRGSLVRRLLLLLGRRWPLHEPATSSSLYLLTPYIDFKSCPYVLMGFFVACNIPLLHSFSSSKDI